MLDFLFRGLTAASPRGGALFDQLTSKAREPHWYVEGTVPDTLDGRFAVLASVVALALVRIEQDGAAANDASVALTERFIEVMESEHRELGQGDPTLGRTVRRLVGSLGRRTSLWRDAVSGKREWIEATRQSLFKGGVDPEALRHCAAALARLWKRLETASIAQLEQGKLQ